VILNHGLVKQRTQQNHNEPKAAFLTPKKDAAKELEKV
jgi:hypothetical protein